MKDDQEGELQRDPRHVYANPKEPDICPILAWAIYFAVFGFNSKILAAYRQIMSLILPVQARQPKPAFLGWIGICLKHKTHMPVMKLHVIASSDALWLAYLVKHRCLLAYLPSLKPWMKLCETLSTFVPLKLKVLAITCGRSLVYHYEHFLETLDKILVLFSSPLYRDVGLPQILNKKLIYRRWCLMT
ncbi:hypothetical protein PHMEG_00023405 [Phytophthora megakarya]|uniref:Uncharacterized protein n=1 Tax=Phytophthora megakarya TaxID=4795 RepID=A0A225VH59_9STRA|nr:hypothetical protein PHMEG_00023405 [Phytophthora megakarya]